MRSELPQDLVLTEAQMREVIELAARLPPRSQGISLADLRQIARDLDIDDDALEQALQQVLGRQTLRLRFTRLLRRAMEWERAWAGGLVGAFLGWLSGHVTGTLREVVNGMTIMRGSGAFIDLPVLVALILLTVLNWLSRRSQGRRRDFLIETSATWGAYYFVRSLTDGYLAQDATWVVLSVLAAFTVWGWLIIRPGELRWPAAGRHPVLRLGPPDASDHRWYPLLLWLRRQ